jgi:Fur family ferric uptake transcriptional regulator
MTIKPSTQQISFLVDSLEAEGYRLTSARKVIAAAMVSSGGHCSADELVTLVREMTPGVGRMTVYRTLDLFCRLGLVRPFYPGTGAAHYALMDSGHHHHLVCSACGEIIDVEDCELEEIAQERIGDRFDFEIQGHLLEFYGLCSQCRT